MALRAPSCLALIALACAFAAAPASAGQWAGHSTVTPDPGGGLSVSQPRFAADAAGNQVAVWNEGGGATFSVKAALRSPGGGWGPAQTLDSTSTTAPATDLAVDSVGNFVVIFTGTAGGMFVKAAYRAAGSAAFGPVEGIQSGSTPALSGPAVDFDPQGRAILVYQQSSLAQVARIRSAGPGGTWTAAGTFPATSGGANTDLIVDEAGNATFVDVATAILRHYRRLAAGGNWTQLTNAPNNASAAITPRIGVDSAGRTTTVFAQQLTTTQAASQLCPAGAPAACNNSVSFPLTSGIRNAQSPDIAVDAAGNAIAVWNEDTNVARTAVRVGPTSPFGAPTSLGNGINSVVSLDAFGDPFALFQQPVPGDDVVFATGSPGGTLGAFAAASVPAEAWANPRIAADGLGNVFGLWAGNGLQSAVYDVTAPALTNVSVPADAVAGQAVALSAAGTDDWTGPPAVTWDFGDGEAGAGGSVGHAYAAPGAYTARATATDGAGNQSSEVRTVNVAAAPPPPPPLDQLPPPVLFKSINVIIVKPPISIKLPGQRTFKPLLKSANLPNGTVINARKGRVKVVIANVKGGTDAADFYEGVFEVNQPKNLKGLANIFLNGGGFKGCPKAPKAQLAAKRLSKTRSVRHLWGSGSGKFRTVGRFSSATIRGTKWLTDDKCNGTLTRVTQGSVNVRDFVKKKTVVVKAPKKYLALAKRR